MERDERLDDQGFGDLANASGDLRWPLLERHFARGVVVVVLSPLDLLAVAKVMAQNEADVLAAWMAAGLVRKATDEDAKTWADQDPLLNAVVVAPWVVVQINHST